LSGSHALRFGSRRILGLDAETSAAGLQLRTACRASVDAFRKALPDLPRPGNIVEGDTPGYLFTPPGAGPFPTILHIGGYDTPAEELYASVYPALDRARAAFSTTGACRSARTGSMWCQACSTSSRACPGSTSRPPRHASIRCSRCRPCGRCSGRAW